MYDFHTHTFLSDGVLSPVELIRRALDQGYRAIAVTDHVGLGNVEYVVKTLVIDCGQAIPGDLDGDGTVGIFDLLILLSNWGPCPDPPDPCAADLDGDGNIGILDLLTLLANWG